MTALQPVASAEYLRRIYDTHLRNVAYPQRLAFEYGLRNVYRSWRAFGPPPATLGFLPYGCSLAMTRKRVRVSVRFPICLRGPATGAVGP